MTDALPLDVILGDFMFPSSFFFSLFSGRLSCGDERLSLGCRLVFLFPSVIPLLSVVIPLLSLSNRWYIKT